jgi:hypothetical protein
MSALGAAQYTELVASTLEKIESNLVDQVFGKHPTLDVLTKYAKPASGRSLVLNIEAAEDANTVLTDASGSFGLERSPDIIGAAEYQWSSPYVSKVRVDWMTLQKNTGKEAIVNLLEAHVENVKKSHAKRLVTGLHKLHANVVAGEFHSLDQLFGTHAYSPTVGGITATNGGQKGFWNATRLTSEGRVGQAGYVTIRKAVRQLRNQINIASGGHANIDVIIAGLGVFEEYEDSFDDKVRYVDFDKGQTRFRAIYDGDIEIRLDPDCPSNRAYFIDSSTLRFQHLNGNFMKVQPSQPITGTLDFVTPVASVLAIGVNSRRNNGVLIRTYA